MRHAWKTAILLLVALGAANPTQAQEPNSTIPPELILERFTVNKRGDALLVPVKIAGKERLFLVDTDCSFVVVDPSHVPLGEPTKVVTADAPGGKVELKKYRAPEASVGRLLLGVDHVLAMDMKPFQEGMGRPIEGILGMDFLCRHVMQVDFDRGELLFLKSVPNDAGEALTISRNVNGIPTVQAKLSPNQIVTFEIDTGALGLESGDVVRDVRKGNKGFRKVGSTSMVTASGEHEFALLEGTRISLGSFAVEKPLFAESPTRSLLGLGFLSRFVVTFDFPNQKMYLRKGKEYERPDLHDQSGLYLIPKNGAIVVGGVDDFSPASLARFKEGDVLLTLGTRRIKEMSPYAIHKTLCTPGELACTVRRGSEEHRLTLNLPR